MEIERKFLLGDFPENLPLLEEAIAQQGYLATTPVVRIRSKQTKEGTFYRLCIKGKGLLTRKEVELELTKAAFLELKEIIGTELIQKEYRVYRLPSGHRLECSFVDSGTPTAFRYAEVEFATEKEAEQFVPPPFLLQEVTFDPFYSMNRYWERIHQN